MAAPLHYSSVYGLYEALEVPLMTFAVNGEVTYANRAARQHPGQPVQVLAGQAVIKALLADATLGKLRLPYETTIELRDGHKLHGQFLPGPAGLDIAFLGRSDSGTARAPGQATLALKEVFELLRDEVNPPISQLMTQLKKLPAAPADHPLAQAALNLERRLVRLQELVEVFGDDVLNTNDRIELLPMFQEVCRDLLPLARRMAVRIELKRPADTLPPIYGNRRMIYRALYECVDNAITHSRQEIANEHGLQVEIGFTLSGEHILVGVRNQGATQVKLNSKADLQPFAGPGVAAAGESLPRLGLPLIQRIVGLHGGQIRVNTSDQGMVQMLMEFPTGAPARGQAGLGIAQAQRYAQDLAQLMSRRKKEKV